MVTYERPTLTAVGSFFKLTGVGDKKFKDLLAHGNLL
jgi:hypothetical protein